MSTNTNCKICLKPIYRKPSQLIVNKNNYCSKKCYGISCRKYVKCIVCGTEVPGTKHAKTCSRVCSNKNREGIQYKKNQPNSKAEKGRKLKKILMFVRGKQCEMCQYDNINILEIHHILERHKGGTDELNNLLLLCPNCHTTIHKGDSRILLSDI